MEHSPASEPTWLEPDARAEYWNTHVAGHVDDLNGTVDTNQHGMTFHVSTWKNNAGDRLVLLSEMC